MREILETYLIPITETWEEIYLYLNIYQENDEIKGVAHMNQLWCLYDEISEDAFQIQVGKMMHHQLVKQSMVSYFEFISNLENNTTTNDITSLEHQLFFKLPKVIGAEYLSQHNIKEGFEYVDEGPHSYYWMPFLSTNHIVQYYSEIKGINVITNPSLKVVNTPVINPYLSGQDMKQLTLF